MAASAVRGARAQGSLRPIPNDRLEIRVDRLKGRGVFACAPIAAGTVLEAAPVILVSPTQCKLLDQTILHDYYFDWDADPDGVPGAARGARDAARSRSGSSRCATIRAGRARGSGAMSRKARSILWRSRRSRRATR